MGNAIYHYSCSSVQYEGGDGEGMGEGGIIPINDCCQCIVMTTPLPLRRHGIRIKSRQCRWQLKLEIEMEGEMEMGQRCTVPVVSAVSGVTCIESEALGCISVDVHVHDGVVISILYSPACRWLSSLSSSSFCLMPTLGISS